jgi:hypothetical protein
MMYNASNGYAPSRYVHPMMMHAYQSPVLASPLMSPTPPFGRPYSPSAPAYPGIPTFNPIASTSSGSDPHSRQVLSEEEDEDEPLCSPSMVYRTPLK